MSISACFGKPRGRSKTAPPTCFAKMVKVDRELISSSTSGITFKLKFLGLAVVGGPDCTYWQGAASDTLSALANSCRKKTNQDFLLTVSSSGVHLVSKNPEPWTLLHGHQCYQFQDIAHWLHDLNDKKLFAYCIQMMEPRLYKVLCFRTCKKQQSGKRLSCAFDYAKCLWGSLQANRAELWKSPNRTNEDEVNQKLSLCKCLPKCVAPSDTTCTQENPHMSARKLQRANSFPQCHSTPTTLATISSPGITSTTLPMAQLAIPHAWTSKDHQQVESFDLACTDQEPQALPDRTRSREDKEVQEGTAESTDDQVKCVNCVLPIEAKCTQKSSDEITRKLQESIGSPKTKYSNYVHELKPCAHHGRRLNSYYNVPITTSMQLRLIFPSDHQRDHHGDHQEDHQRDHHGDHQEDHQRDKKITLSCRDHCNLPRSSIHMDSVIPSTVDLENSLGGSMSIEFPLTECMSPFT